MTAENFVYWLQGYLELSGSAKLTEEQVKSVKEHLALVMTKVTPTTPYTHPFWRNEGTGTDKQLVKEKVQIFC